MSLITQMSALDRRDVASRLAVLRAWLVELSLSSVRDEQKRVHLVKSLEQMEAMLKDETR